MHVDCHRSSPSLPERTTVDERLELGKWLALADERRELSGRVRGPSQCRGRASLPRRSQACAASRSSIETTRAPELGHLREPSGRERRHRRSVLDALGLRRGDELEGDGEREQTRLGRERLDGDPELAESALGEAGARAETLRQARERRLEELHGSFARAREDGRQRESGEVERGRERQDLERARRDDTPRPV